MADTDTIKKDFDELAKIYHPKWDHNIHYYKYLLNFIPQDCKTVLDIGCGTGEFARLLSAKSEKVVGIDISPEMISQAKSLSIDFKNIEYKVADFFEKDIPPESFDCVVSIATLHHFYLEPALRRSFDLVKKGGTLIVLDLYKPFAISDYFYSAAAFFPNLFYNIFKNRRLWSPKQIRNAWKQHSKSDKVVSLKDVGKAAFRTSATIKVRRLFFWRYLVVHKKNSY